MKFRVMDFAFPAGMTYALLSAKVPTIVMVVVLVLATAWAVVSYREGLIKGLALLKKGGIHL